MLVFFSTVSPCDEVCVLKMCIFLKWLFIFVLFGFVFYTLSKVFDGEKKQKVSSYSMCCLKSDVLHYSYKNLSKLSLLLNKWVSKCSFKVFNIIIHVQHLSCLSVIAEDKQFSAELEVKTLMKPTFSTVIKDVEVVEGSAARFDCKIEGKIKWLHTAETIYG